MRATHPVLVISPLFRIFLFFLFLFFLGGILSIANGIARNSRMYDEMRERWSGETVCTFCERPDVRAGRFSWFPEEFEALPRIIRNTGIKGVTASFGIPANTGAGGLFKLKKRQQKKLGTNLRYSDSSSVVKARIVFFLLQLEETFCV